jgi:hypothetical protein
LSVRWLIAVLLLLAGLAAFAALYLTDTIKLDEAVLGVALVTGAAAALVLLK